MLSIIIVNYKTPLLVIDCINSIVNQTTETAFEIIVVDNASGDDSVLIIQKAFPAIMVIPMDYNAGFSRANNAGIRKSKGDFVLLLNSNTIVLDHALDKCVALFKTSDCVACGVQLLNVDGSMQVSGQWFFPGNINIALKLPYLQTFYDLFKKLAGKKDKNFGADKPPVTSVDWINGAFLMVKRDAMEKAGLMDEDFFLYAEESEWCSRIGKHGKLCLFNDVKVTHLQGESVKTAFNDTDKGYYNIYDKKGLQFLVSEFLHVRKHHGIIWLLFNYAVYLFYIPFFLLFLILDKIFRVNKAMYTWKLFRGFVNNVFSCIPYIVKMVKGKPFFYKIL